MKDICRKRERRGIAIFLILGIIVFLLILFTVIFNYTRQAAYSVHRFYYKSVSTQIANSILDESETWLGERMEDPDSELYRTIKEKLLEVVEELRDGDDEIAQGPEFDLTEDFKDVIINSRELADFCDVLDADDIAITLSFKNIRNFFLDPEIDDPEHRGYLSPDPAECYGNMLITIAVTTERMTVEHKIWRNFKYINVLPPVISKYSLFVKDQPQPSQVNNLKMWQGPFLFAKGFAETGPNKSRVRPVVVINSLTDFDAAGTPKTQIDLRTMSDGEANDHGVRRKGWIFLGADTLETNGFILNLTCGMLYNMQFGCMWKNSFLSGLTMPNNTKLYYGEYFHRPVTQQFYFSTRDYSAFGSGKAPGPLLDRVDEEEEYYDTLRSNIDELTADGGEFSLRYIVYLMNYMSFTRTMANHSIDPFFLIAFGGINLNQNFKLMFKNYYDQSLDDLVSHPYRRENGLDPRSEHPSLLHLYGEDYLMNSRYYESRSPTLTLGPVKRRFLMMGCLRQESDLDLASPNFVHPYKGLLNKQMKLLWLPFYNIEQDGQYDADRNSIYVDLKWDGLWGRISELNNGYNGYYPDKTWGLKFTALPADKYFLEEDLSNVNGLSSRLNRQIYRNVLMSKVIEENYLYSFDTMCQDGQPAGMLRSPNVLRLENVQSLDWYKNAAVNDDHGFFYSYQGPCHRGIIKLRGMDAEESADETRTLFEGNLRSLSLFSEEFSIDDKRRMNCPEFDLRLKASKVVKQSDFTETYLTPQPGGETELKINDIIYVRRDSESDRTPLYLGREGKTLHITGQGIIIADNDIVIGGNIEPADAGSFNNGSGGKRNLNPENEPLGTIFIAPLTICSVEGSITIDGASRVEAYLVALDEENGTLKAKNLISDFTLIGGLAVHHFDLRFRVRSMPNSELGCPSDRIVPDTDDSVFALSGTNRFRVVYNDNFEPTYNENWDKYYVLKMGPVVYERD